ncbi:11347_t:CDS:2 [Entrophospora sp. SA101]|nr:11347_t:CDS:2 [Entrophospora sp. SA101]
MSTNSLDLEMIENDSNRAQVVATAVREACNIAAASQNQQQDWEAASKKKVELLVQRTSNTPTDVELRKVVKNLDNTVEFARSSHPDPKFVRCQNIKAVFFTILFYGINYDKSRVKF